MMDILKVIEEQVSLNFSGKINILRCDSGQYVGAIVMSEGQLVAADFDRRKRENALFSAVYNSRMDHGLRFVVEPEIVDRESVQFNYSYDQFMKLCESYGKRFEATKKLMPPMHLHLLIKSDFIVDGPQINSREFNLLGVISDYSQVEDIYRYSPYLPFETTEILISLRKKGAVRVVKA